MSTDRFKFRAWDGKRMTEEFHLDSQGAFVARVSSFEEDPTPWLLMQCTGLKDFFESDIIHTNQGNGYIAWDEHALRWIVIFGQDEFGGYEIESLYKVWSSGRYEPCEIIGNIYETTKQHPAQG